MPAAMAEETADTMSASSPSPTTSETLPTAAAAEPAQTAETRTAETRTAEAQAADTAASAAAMRQPSVSATRRTAAAPSADLQIRDNIGGKWSPSGETALALRIVIGLTLLTVLPAMLVSLTAFLRIIIVLSMLRHAMGMQETPPNTVLIGLALFMTIFTMSPVLQKINEDALQPFMAGKLSMESAWNKGSVPLREFMVRQTREQDLALMVELSKAKQPQSMDDISNVQLIPAFMLSELRAAFQIGFVIFLPFLLIDLIVSSILMGLGMMMMPPVAISLPVKILMFILVDGWSLVLKALVGSFH
jgi:flagellar biosynthetic protein FliP